MIKSETSRVKRETEAEKVLLEACRSACADGRPFLIRHGYDNTSIGAYTEFVIWYVQDNDLSPDSSGSPK